MKPSEDKLAALRFLMKDSGVDVYVIPSTDPHLGEYVPDHWRIIAWLTCFTGSHATVVVTDAFAGLWTDSRYYIQAEAQLRESGFTLIKPPMNSSDDFIKWLPDNIQSGNKLALDGRIFSIYGTHKIQEVLERRNITFDFNCDLITSIWIDRPQLRQKPAFDHTVAFCGRERAEKMNDVRTQMKSEKVDYHLLTSIDDIMWLLNIRGDDVKYSPLMTSYSLIGMDNLLLFTDARKIPSDLSSGLEKLGISILPYGETTGVLSALPAGSSILIDPATTSATLFNSIPSGIMIVEDQTIPARMKAIKNKVEIANLTNAMIKDGVALTKFFIWLERNLHLKQISEVSAGKYLDSQRAEAKYYLGPSFSTIMAFNENGALPHYSATPSSDKIIGPDGILLADSGGQYLDGTTDITRTISTGRTTLKQKRDFTRVLKGTIGLAKAKFPEGTRGYQLDILARKALWEAGLNYGHGTGHGVGFCLNVHEGPQSISQGSGPGAKTEIEPGMLISDEPAVYRPGEYGIRIENLLLCFEDEETEFGRYLKFETESLCYIDTTLIDISLLSEHEIAWLNSYHIKVYDKLSPYLDRAEREWLKCKTCAI